MHLVKSILSGAAAVGAFSESAESSEPSENWKIYLFLGGQLAPDNPASDLFGILGNVLVIFDDVWIQICYSGWVFGMVYIVLWMMHLGNEI